MDSTMQIKMIDADGKAQTWTLWKCRVSGYWKLTAPDGYVRALERDWAGSVPRIHAIAENHGLRTRMS